MTNKEVSTKMHNSAKKEKRLMITKYYSRDV